MGNNNSSDEPSSVFVKTRPLTKIYERVRRSVQVEVDFEDEQPSVRPTFKSRYPDEPEYNILLLGQTGAGKSTTINAIANYLKFDSLAAASSGEFETLIPARFRLTNPQTGDNMLIQSDKDAIAGCDENERWRITDESGSEGDVSQSNTMMPQAYTFRTEQGLMRIIDTPGIGDTKGAPIDEENFEAILNHLMLYRHLHGICILLKSIENRQTVFLKYCITQLLTHLHKSACTSIIFLFTFSRTSFYRPGDGYSTAESFLKSEFPGIELELNAGEHSKRNCFFLVNEAYRCLVARNQGFPIDAQSESGYKESWDKSSEQTKLLWKRVRANVPHDLRRTQSLNNARKIILELAEPMVLLQSTIDANIAEIKDSKEQIDKSRTNQDKLAKSLHIEVDRLEAKRLEKPITVCTAKSCMEYIKVGKVVKRKYKTHCHENCKRKTVELNTKGEAELNKCWAFKKSGLRGMCRRCGCNWKTHVHIKCEYTKVKRKIVDNDKLQELKSERQAAEHISQAKQTIETTVKELQAEYDIIQDVSKKFASMLIKNSNTPFNRFLDEYVDMQIEQEQRKISEISDYSDATLKALRKIKATHADTVRILNKAMVNRSQKNIELDDIDLYVEELRQLKHSGGQFEQIMSLTKSIKEDLAKEEMLEAEQRGRDLRIVDQVKSLAPAVGYSLKSGTRAQRFSTKQNKQNKNSQLRTYRKFDDNF